jgi:hypothetical protein
VVIFASSFAPHSKMNRTDMKWSLRPTYGPFCGGKDTESNSDDVTWPEDDDGGGGLARVFRMDLTAGPMLDEFMVARGKATTLFSCKRYKRICR